LIASQAEKQIQRCLVPEYIHPWQLLADGAGLPAKNLRFPGWMSKVGCINGMEAFLD
jgi:hypothetical protein